MLHSVGTSFGAFFALRFILGKFLLLSIFDWGLLTTSFEGMCESCVAPSLILIISMFYKKNEQVRKTHLSATKHELNSIDISLDAFHGSM